MREIHLSSNDLAEILKIDNKNVKNLKTLLIKWRDITFIKMEKIRGQKLFGADELDNQARDKLVDILSKHIPANDLTKIKETIEHWTGKDIN